MKIPVESAERLERISKQVESAEKAANSNENKVLADLKWMIKELRDAWKKLEAE
jgi:hypothetical protein